MEPWMRIIAIVFSLALAGCASSIEENQQWSIRGAAPDRYDMWLINAHLEKPGVRSWRAPLGGQIGCCWSGAGGPVGSGGEMNPFPSLIALHWFSFAEQKFYFSLIRVPEGLQDKMRKPAAHSYPDGTTGLRPRSSLVLGLAPGGQVVMWMMSQRSNAVEVMRVSATEVDGDPDDFASATASYLEEHGDYLEEHGLQLDKW